MGQVGLNYWWERVMTGKHKGKSEKGSFLNTAESMSVGTLTTGTSLSH